MTALSTTGWKAGGIHCTTVTVRFGDFPVRRVTITDRADGCYRNPGADRAPSHHEHWSTHWSGAYAGSVL